MPKLEFLHPFPYGSHWFIQFQAAFYLIFRALAMVIHSSNFMIPVIMSFFLLFLRSQPSEAPTRPASQASSCRDFPDGEPRSPVDSHVSGSSSSLSTPDETNINLKVQVEGEPQINEVDVVYVQYPDDCFCNICIRKCACCTTCPKTKVGQLWWKLRCFCYTMVEHRYFETFVMTMIAASSVSLVKISRKITWNSHQCFPYLII